MELLEVLNTPTPFIAGVHTSLLPQLPNLVSLFAFKCDYKHLIDYVNVFCMQVSVDTDTKLSHMC